MGYKALSWAASSDAPSTASYAVLCALANFADENGECFPSQISLSEKTKLSERSIRTQIGKLIDSRLIEKKQVKGRFGYRLLITESPETVSAYRNDVPVNRKHVPVKEAEQPETRSGKPETVSEQPETRSGESVINQLLSKKEESPLPPKKMNNHKKTNQMPQPPNWLDEKIWNDFLSERSKNKKPMTPRAAELNFEKLDLWRKAGHDPVEIVKNSIANGWQGLFEPKQNSKGNGNEKFKREPTKWERQQAAIQRAKDALGIGQEPPNNGDGAPMLRHIEHIRETTGTA